MKLIKDRYYLINDCNAGEMIGKYLYTVSNHPFPYFFKIVKSNSLPQLCGHRRMRENEIIREITSEEMLAIML